MYRPNFDNLEKEVEKKVKKREKKKKPKMKIDSGNLKKVMKIIINKK